MGAASLGRELIVAEADDAVEPWPRIAKSAPASTGWRVDRAAQHAPGPLGRQMGVRRGEIEVQRRCRAHRRSSHHPRPDGGRAVDVIERLHRAGAEVWVTVTTPDEARAAAGADALVVQGAEAGGHRGGDGAVPLLALLDATRAVTDLPLIATGGIATRDHVLAAGAVAAQAATAFLLAPEAGPAGAHRDAAPARRRAREAGDADLINLWAGTQHHLAVARPAAETVRALTP